MFDEDGNGSYLKIKKSDSSVLETATFKYTINGSKLTITNISSNITNFTSWRLIGENDTQNDTGVFADNTLTITLCTYKGLAEGGTSYTFSKQ